MKILSLQEIKSKIDIPKIIKLQEKGFIAASKGEANIPMPGYIKHDNPSGSYHIKYCHIKNDKFLIIKIAGGPDHLPINGMMLVINIKTGTVEYLLQDQGYLTSLRTAVAGLIAAKLLANKNIYAIGIVGTGTQARMQLEILQNWTNCKNAYAWGRNKLKTQNYKNDMEAKGFNIKIVQNISELTNNCNLIITTTASEEPLIKTSDIQLGTHITAVGADSPGKIELDPKLIAKADIVAVDSKKQCIDHGEIHHAFKNKLINEDQLTELGDIIYNKSLGRQNNKQITIADLTGIATQDIQIVKAIINNKNDQRLY
ncbi:MAG: hypothetical protein HRU36_05935 [Rickettsiales bacterium]|nr:hypothetical protein [Rickettsiales bacterium]